MINVLHQDQDVQELEKKFAKEEIFFVDYQDLEKEIALKEDVVMFKQSVMERNVKDNTKIVNGLEKQDADHSHTNANYKIIKIT
jgi:hypothetical protein